MNTIGRLELLLKGFTNCPLNLARVELETFNNVLKLDAHLMVILTEVISSNEDKLQVKASNIVSDVRTSSWTDLSFANSAKLRAAVGFQVVQSLLGEQNALKCGKKVMTIGAFYSAYQGGRGEPSPVDAIRVFSEVFLHPLVDYLHGAVEVHGQMLVLLSRYKQRGEWFPDKEIIKSIKSGAVISEQELKRDFLRYLFDNEIEFSLEAETPIEGGEVDVLPILPDLGVLPIEVKVFDGKSRNKAYISAGLAQASDYARKFNRPNAYLVIYNIAKDTVLTVPGTTVGPNVVTIPIQGVATYSVVVNLNRTLQSSKAQGLKSVEIPVS